MAYKLPQTINISPNCLWSSVILKLYCMRNVSASSYKNRRDIYVYRDEIEREIEREREIYLSYQSIVRTERAVNNPKTDFIHVEVHIIIVSCVESIASRNSRIWQLYACKSFICVAINICIFIYLIKESHLLIFLEVVKSSLTTKSEFFCW